MRCGLAAISAIDHALWDISAKALGVPVYMLLGGHARDRVRVYAGVYTAPDPEECRATLDGLHGEWGFSAFKLSPYRIDIHASRWGLVVAAAADYFARLREICPASFEFAFDAHAKIFEPWQAVQLGNALAPYDPMFFEEPIRPEHIPAWARLRSELRCPLATGELLYSRFEFLSLLAAGGADIIQPDICVVGGLLEMRKIAALAEAHYVTVAPHNPMGPLATAVNLHFSAAQPNFKILEYRLPLEDPLGRRSLSAEGRLSRAAPRSPGLGRGDRRGGCSPGTTMSIGSESCRFGRTARSATPERRCPEPGPDHGRSRLGPGPCRRRTGRYLPMGDYSRRLVMRTQLVAVVLLIFLGAGAGTPARAGSPVVSAGDQAAIQGVITSQLDAFRHDNGPAAFALASPAIQGLFGTPERFMAIVQQSYQPVYRPREVDFRDVVSFQGHPTQRVVIVGTRRRARGGLLSDGTGGRRPLAHRRLRADGLGGVSRLRR